MGLLNKVKQNIYVKMVEWNLDLKKDYEEYKTFDPVFHHLHKFSSWKYLKRLNKYYKNPDKLKKPLSPNPDFNNKELANAVSNSNMPNVQTISPQKTLPKDGIIYLDGAESSLSKLPDPHFWVKKLLKYDVISFDIFDTLIFRPFVQPTDIFFLLQEKLDYFDFAEQRKLAEKKAREMMMAKFKTREVTIYDIYDVIERELGINRDYGVQCELDCEMDVCFANPFMKRVFDILKSRGKRIIAISDMYFPKPIMQKLLEKCGYNGFENIFVSCDAKSGKGSGVLYDLVKSEVGKDLTYIHIGDNYSADYEKAQKHGFDAVHYKNVNAQGNPYRATFNGMSECVGHAYGGIINSYLHNGMDVIDPYFEYGMLYGGLYVLGFCQWIRQYALNHNVDKILFLARDGDIYRKVFNLLGNDIPSEYVYWSRMPSIRLVAEKDRYDFLTRYITHRIHDVNPMPIENIFKMLSIDSLIPKAKKYGINMKHFVTKENEEFIKHFFIDHWDEIVKSFEPEQELARGYFEKLIGDSTHIAVIDVGWQGSGPKAIKWLVEKKWGMDCKVDCLLACAYSFNNTANLTQIESGELNAYIFTRMYNRNLFDWHLKTNNHQNNIMFEIFTQTSTPTFERFGCNSDGDLEMHFGFCEAENYGIIRKVHDGILEFANIYINTFKKYPFMLNISGYDAYMPFRLLTRNPLLVKNLFKDFVITKNLGVDTASFRMETLGEIFDKVKL